MKKYILFVFIIVFGFLIASNAWAQFSVSSTSAKSVEVVVSSPNSEYLRGEVDLVAIISGTGLEKGDWVLVGEVSKKDASGEVFTLGKSNCKIGASMETTISSIFTEEKNKCFITSWDTNDQTSQLGDGMYDFWVSAKPSLESKDIYESKKISVVIDNTAPEIDLNGNESVTITAGSEYAELGATATDNIDESVNVNISGSVNTNEIGSYIITYDATDKAGNSVSKSRNIEVIRNRSSSSSGSYVARGPSTPIIASPVAGQVLGEEKFNFTLLLKTGLINEEVKQLQIYLNAHGYPLALTGPGSSGNETTKFGALTRMAVIKFQLANNLAGDGIVGPLTREVLNK